MKIAWVAFAVAPVPPTVAFPAGGYAATAGTPADIVATVTGDGAVASVKWWASRDGEAWEEWPQYATAAPSITFPAAGEYELYADVTDTNGAAGSTSVTVVVAPAAPALTVTGPASILEGQVAQFHITVTDPEAGDEPALYADWNGDGEWEMIDKGEIDAYDAATQTYAVSHKFDNNPAAAGVAAFTAAFAAGDARGAAGAGQATIAVADVKPTFRLEATNVGPRVSANDYPIINQGLAVGVTPGPKLIAGLPRIGVHEGIGKDIYYASPGTHIILTGSDTSFEDQESLTAEWQAGALAVNGNVLTVPAAAPRGVLHEVSVRVRDGRGVLSEPKTFYVTVDDTVAMTSYPLFAKLSATGWDFPDVNPYTMVGVAVGPRQGTVPQPANNFKFRINLTAESEAWLQQSAGADVTYHYVATRVGGAAVDPEVQNFSRAQNEAVEFPFVYPEPVAAGQTLTVEAWVTVGAAGGLGRTPYYNQAAYTVQADQTLSDKLFAVEQLALELPQQFGALMSNLVAALTGDSPLHVISSLATGFSDGLKEFLEKIKADPLLPVMTWLLGTPEAGNFQIATVDDIPGAVLKYLGLDEETIRAQIIAAVGDGHLEALDKLESVFAAMDAPGAPDLSDPKAMWQFLTKSEENGGLGLDVQTIYDEMVATLVSEVKNELPRVAVQIATKFVPGLGVLKTILTTGEWLLNNVAAIKAAFQPLFALTQADFEATELANPAAKRVKAAVVAALPNVLNVTLDLVATQFGFGRIKKLFRDNVKDLPGKVTGAINAAVGALADKARLAAVGGAGAAYKGQVGQRYPFEYHGKNYQFVIARTTGTKNFVVRVVLDGKIVTELTEKQINDNPGLPAAAQAAMVGHLRAMEGAARALETALDASRERATVKKTQRRANRHGEAPPPPSNLKPTLATLAKNLRDAVAALGADLHQHGCAAINAGCFAAGTQLWTPDGYRNVEDIQVGDLVFSRNEYDPAGLIEAKPVEACFTRTGRILHLHFAGGELIRTTPEHPFYVHSRGWVAAGELAAGDFVLTDNGEWKTVAEAFDTGEYEVVYNIRVEDHHTYFVGATEWGWAAWAHNAYFFHGTSKAYAASIMLSGINSAYFESNKDFGLGFYTTTLDFQAVGWARKKSDGGAVIRYYVPDAVLAELTHRDFGLSENSEWQNTVRRGRMGELDAQPNPIGTDIASGLLLRNWKAMTSDPQSASLAEGTGQQTTWLTNNAFQKLQAIKPVYVFGGPKS